jgi:hypothetical protein
MSNLTALQAVTENLGVTAKTNNLTEQLNALLDTVGGEHGNNVEDCLKNYAKSMGTIEPITTGVTVAAMSGSATVWEHTVSDLQEDIEVTGNKITGKLMQCTEGALPAKWGPGYFLCLQFSNFVTGTTSCLAGVKPPLGSGYGDVYEDTDHAMVVQINDRNLQKVKVITAAGARSLTQTFDISELEFVPADED